MGVKNLFEKKSKAKVDEESESESESEIEFDYNDDEEDDGSSEEEEEEENSSDDSETANEEPDIKKTTEKKKIERNSKLKRSAISSEDDANEASAEDDDNNEENDTKPKKKKLKKMSKLEKSTDASEDEESEEDEASDEEVDESNEAADDESEGDGGEEEDGEEVKAHKGFADALSNILKKKTVSSKKVILAQGKTDKEIKKIKESRLPPEEKESQEPLLTHLELEEKRLKRKLWLEMGKVKPDALEKNRERQLKMIATRGVVQLFNAVKKQQKMVNDNLADAHSERKKDIVIESMSKKSFINLLQNTKVDVSMATAEKETPVAKEPERKIWSVLRDDFVIGTGKMKDWDKQDDLEI